MEEPMTTPLKSVDQLELPGLRLGELVRELLDVEAEKKAANEDWNAQIKMLKIQIAQVALEMKA
jgi:hypothetical protein